MYIQHEDQLELCRKALVDATELFVDTEFESRRSGTELCLIQVTDGTNAFLIDAIQIDDLTALKPVFDKPDMTWILHAGRQDIELLMTAFDMTERPRIFDTQVGWSLVSAEYQVSLSYLEMRLLGLRKDKGKQTSNWKRRPLGEDQLDYAIGDVLGLPAIYKFLLDALEGHGRLDAGFEASGEVFKKRIQKREAISLSSYRNLWQLSPKQQVGLKVLVKWFNQAGERRGSPHWKSLFNIAAAQPDTLSELSEIKGVGRDWAKAIGTDLIKEIKAQSAEVSDESETHALAPSPYSTFEQHLREAWLISARADVCASAHIAPEVAFPSWLMKRLKTTIHDVSDPIYLADEFTGWRTCLKSPWRAFCEETSSSD
tara:strand:+ start:465 stop:1577 length:1113 start_codon:yes stop_codon:yes gene_type:complete